MGFPLRSPESTSHLVRQTVGTTYLVAGNVAGKRVDNHVERAARLALRLQKRLPELAAQLGISEEMSEGDSEGLFLRIGLHAGPVTGAARPLCNRL